MDLRIYNLFPRLFSGIDAWVIAAQEAKKMGFNAIYLNPFFETGESKSIYSISDYKCFDPISVGHLPWDQCVEKVKTFSAQCCEMGMEVIFDLVINHTAIDSPLCFRHPDWYEHSTDGSILPAYTYTADRVKVVWEDCAKLSYESGSRSLWEYIESICRFYLDLGATGFRCDVACHVLPWFWKYLIGSLRQDYPRVLFLGEAFLASQTEISQLADAGFDYIFNSARWWDLSQHWLPKQLNTVKGMIATISFPDNHDTSRLFAELEGNLAQYRQRLKLLSILSSGFMITSGFEYGFQKRLNVKTTCVSDWEDTGIDLREDIYNALQLRTQFPIFREDGTFELFSPENSELLVMEKTAANQKALILANRTEQPVCFPTSSLYELFPFAECIAEETLELSPFEVRFFVPSLQNTSSESLPDNELYFLAAPHSLVKKTVPLLSLKPGEALVEIMGCGICGSDYQEYRNGRFFWPASGTGGHEFVGVVRSLFPPENGLRLSDRVIYRIPRQGTGIVQGGGFSRFAVVRCQCLHKLTDLDEPHRLVLAEPLAAAVHAGRMAAGSNSIAVIGSGTIALLLCRFLALERPDAAITLYYKHDHILRFLPETISACPFSMLASARRAYMPYEEYDLIYDCSGKEDAVLRAVHALRDNGLLILTGIYRSGANSLPFSDLMFREKRIQGSFLYTKEEFMQAMDLLRSKKITVDDFITEMPFSDCPSAFSTPSNQRIKIVLWNDAIGGK